MIRKILAIAVLALSAVPQPSFAWGRTGHAAVANIAELRLNSRAKAKVMKLLALDGNNHMADVSSWADPQRDAYPVVHSTRIPFDGRTAPAHACPDLDKLCADEAISKYMKTLKNGSASPTDRYVALKFIIHLVGDLHQPLHGSDPIGYNEVTFNGSAKTRIHAFWDGVIIEQHGLGSAALARELLNNGVDVKTGGSPREWAIESSNLARDAIYDTLPACYPRKRPRCPTTPMALPSNYASRAYPVVARRLKQAGLRLAEMLNDALGA